MIDEKRLKRQEEIIQKWVKGGAAGTVEACTGFGKTYLAILAIKRFRKKYHAPEDVIKVVVPSIPLKAQWENNLRKQEVENVEVWVINSYIKHTHTCVLLILDEVHRYASEEFSKVFEYTSYTFILGLTATLERIDGKDSLIEERAPIFDRVTLEEAKREGYVSDFRVYNLGLEFNREDQATYDDLHSKFNAAFAYFDRNFDLAMDCAAGEGVIKGYSGSTPLTGKLIRDRFARHKGWSPQIPDHTYAPQNIMIKAQTFLRTMRKRKEIIYKASTKVETIVEIVNKFPDKKIMVFAEDSEFANKVEEALGREVCRAYHTKIKSELRSEKSVKVTKKGTTVTEKQVKWGPTKLKLEILDLFTRGVIRVLSTVRALDEGYDEDSIDMIIMASYNSSKRQDTQRTGRGVRINKTGDKVAVVINLFMKGSQEEKWLDTKQDGKTGIYIKEIESVDEIEIGSSVVSLI
jgi:superfamily II DNA or RNA helicase